MMVRKMKLKHDDKERMNSCETQFENVERYEYINTTRDEETGWRRRAKVDACTFTQ